MNFNRGIIENFSSTNEWFKFTMETKQHKHFYLSIISFNGKCIICYCGLATKTIKRRLISVAMVTMLLVREICFNFERSRVQEIGSLVNPEIFVTIDHFGSVIIVAGSLHS